MRTVAKQSKDPTPTAATSSGASSMAADSSSTPSMIVLTGSRIVGNGSSSSSSSSSSLPPRPQQQQLKDAFRPRKKSEERGVGGSSSSSSLPSQQEQQQASPSRLRDAFRARAPEGGSSSSDVDQRHAGATANTTMQAPRRARAITSARRFHDRHLAAIQRQAARGRAKRDEYEERRARIEQTLNSENATAEAAAAASRARARDDAPPTSHRAHGPASTSGFDPLDLHREHFFASLLDSQTRQQEQMEEYELALAISLSMAEAEVPSAVHRMSPPLGMAPVSMSARPTHAPPLGAGIIPRRPVVSSSRRPAHRTASHHSHPSPRSHSPAQHQHLGLDLRTERMGGSAGAGAPGEVWEMDGMSYEELCQLEDVKVTATRDDIRALRTVVLTGSGGDLERKIGDQVCSICQCGFDKGEKVTVLGCGHALHAECCEEWFGKYSKVCPVCKEPIC